MFLGLSFAAWFVIFVVVLVFVLQICTKLPSDFVFLGGMALLLVSGVIPVKSVIGSFSSSTVVLIGALFVVICGLVHTGFLQWVVRYCLGTPKTYNKAIVRLGFIVCSDQVRPSLEFDREFITEAKSGDNFVLPNYTVKDNGDVTKVIVKAYLCTPDGIMHAIKGKSVTFTGAGTYVIYYQLIDENDNSAFYAFTVCVR
jgi:hypothetical protein